MAVYKKPRRINVVSVLVVVLLLAGGFLGYRAWPVLSLRAEVKDAFLDALPRLYRANLLPEPEAAVAAEQARTALVTRLGELGVADAEKALAIARDAKEVSIAIELRTALDLDPIARIPITLAPRVSTSAARVSF